MLYILEPLPHSQDTLEVHIDAIKKGDVVLVVDDLLATGGTCMAACKLIERLEGEVYECSFIVDLPDVGGIARLEKEGYNVFKLVDFAILNLETSIFELSRYFS